MQQILGYTPIEAGLAFLPVTFGIGIGAGLAQQLVKRIGVRCDRASSAWCSPRSASTVLSRVPVDGTYLATCCPA